jgi:hypothetical protein
MVECVGFIIDRGNLYNGLCWWLHDVSWLWTIDTWSGFTGGEFDVLSEGSVSDVILMGD